MDYPTFPINGIDGHEMDSLLFKNDVYNDLATAPQINENIGNAFWLYPDIPMLRDTENGLQPGRFDVSAKQTKRRLKAFSCSLCPKDKPKNFGTKNDLDRHMKSVHNQYRTGTIFWLCPFAACSSLRKLWPRFDNFKTHVLHMHGQVSKSDLRSCCLSVG